MKRVFSAAALTVLVSFVLLGTISTAQAASPVAAESTAAASATLVVQDGAPYARGAVTRGKIIPWYKARKYVGRRVTVRGTVVSSKYAKGTAGRPTFLNLGRKYPNPKRFTAVIWGKNRWRFPKRPERYYLRKKVLVNGVITLYKGSAQTFLVYRSRIKVLE